MGSIFSVTEFRPLNFFLKYLAFLLLLIGATFQNETYAKCSNLIISPGKCIGTLCIGDSKKYVRNKLGRPIVHKELNPQFSVDLWESEKNMRQYLFVVFDNDKIIEIHTSENKYKTTSNISLESNYSDVKKSFPHGIEDEFGLFESDRNRVDWVDTSKGITFSFADDSSGPMVRIIVHKRSATKLIGYSVGDDWYWYPITESK